MHQQLSPDKIKHVLAVTRSVNTMVHFENREGDDMVTLATGNIEERPVTTWWTRSRYVAVAGCLVTSLAVVTTVSVYLTSNDTATLAKVEQNSDYPYHPPPLFQGHGEFHLDTFLI